LIPTDLRIHQGLSRPAHSSASQTKQEQQSSMSNSADTGAPTAAAIAAAGITYPPIDELLTKTSSKYGLSIYAAKRARQINDYYAQLGEGLLEYVGPLVEPLPKEKPLSIALREINAGLLTHTEGE
jgi:DNA-directed RNA polymerase subunit omega